MLTPEQERDLQQRIDRSLTAAHRLLEQAGVRPSQKERYASAQRVKAFMDQAQQALQQGDLNRALSLAGRAELLASDLVRTSR